MKKELMKNVYLNETMLIIKPKRSNGLNLILILH